MTRTNADVIMTSVEAKPAGQDGQGGRAARCGEKRNDLGLEDKESGRWWINLEDKGV